MFRILELIDSKKPDNSHSVYQMQENGDQIDHSP